MNARDFYKAWDPDFTKATPEEAKRIADAEKSGFVSESEIDWDSIGADIPNAETAAAFEELDNGGGEWFNGSTKDYLAKLSEN